jgi:hypothetical protein
MIRVLDLTHLPKVTIFVYLDPILMEFKKINIPLLPIEKKTHYLKIYQKLCIPTTLVGSMFLLFFLKKEKNVDLTIINNKTLRVIQSFSKHQQKG